jgi:hypothetical protein
MTSNTSSINKLEKYNPDVDKKYEIKQRERDGTAYTYSNVVYKGITNDFPKQIATPDDLKIKAEQPDFNLIKIKMEASINEREQEKANQEKILKELAEKKLNKKLVINQTSTNTTLETHSDMKQAHQKFNIEKNDNLVKEKSVLNDVLDFLNKI